MDVNPNYDVVWTSQSENSAGSMPVGGYDAGANVWVEKEELFLYVDRSGSFDENNQMLKLGRFRLRFEPSPFAGSFCQRLCLERGSVLLEGADGFRAEIWFHTDSPMLRIDVRSDAPVRACVTYESWRTQPRLIPKAYSPAPFSFNGYPGDVYTWPDCVQPGEDQLVFFHQNQNDKLLFDFLTAQQGLEAVKGQMMNPQRDFVFGGLMAGEGLRYEGRTEGEYAGVPFAGYRYAAPAAREHRVFVGFHSEQASLDGWLERLKALCAAQPARADARDSALCWWRDFWSRSHIRINPEDASDEGFQIARNHALFRYMLGCNARGEYPTKFNGGLFTTDAVYSVDPSFAGETPDYRRWGGGSFTAQNQRLVYWPMLKSGDFDMMAPQFQFYLRALPNAEVRTRHYWGHGGCSFTEQVENMGLPVGTCWGFDAPGRGHLTRHPHWKPAELRCPWIKYEYVTQLEFAYMMLEYRRYTGADISAMLPFVKACVTFFSEHYEMIRTSTTLAPLDENGHWVIYPSTALETYKDARNPTDVLSALKAVLEGLCEISHGEELAEYRAMADKVAPVALREREGVVCIAPAQSWSGIINHELPQLYPVFPYGQYGIGREGLELARSTYWHGVDKPSQRGHESWRQDGIFAARLGLTGEAKRIAGLKLGNGPLRFPAFWGPGYDWLPDHNWGGSGTIGLQDMLVQWVDGNIHLFPAWPEEWKADFKLHLPGNTVVEAEWDGEGISWSVESQADFAVVLPDGTVHRQARRQGVRAQMRKEGEAEA